MRSSFFCVFYTVSNIYNNQLNGLRQYTALIIFPIITNFICERKNIKEIVLILFPMTFYLTAVLFFIAYSLRYISAILSENIFCYFYY
ncbi:hypothetical protein [Symbiopectobacterium purcellii]|uniref:Uncharacterized protein n=1 Tax=Symbiopectobacterium purcellii TaxID=2871826 RepID=A0ABX9AYE3_9ENTR|nr:hypothetical protein K6K13_06770 [Symbiopectobacterium purcellii]